MFKITEAATRLPVRFPVKPGVVLAPGHVTKTVEYNGFLVTDICDGYDALGLVQNRCIGGNEIDFKNVAKIHLQRMIVDISKFDRENEIHKGNSLYCNGVGELSSKKPFENSLVLAKAISPCNEEKSHMTILWV